MMRNNLKSLREKLEDLGFEPEVHKNCHKNCIMLTINEYYVMIERESPVFLLSILNTTDDNLIEEKIINEAVIFRKLQKLEQGIGL